MYVAKQAQQGVEVYSRDRDDNDVRGLALVTELRLDLDEDALEVHFQPLVALSTGVVHGVESLVRWTSASYGSVAPDEFIPMAETTGLINLLTERVLRRSLAQAAAWRAQVLHLNVAVNPPPTTPLRGDVVGLVVRCLAAAPVPGTVLTPDALGQTSRGDTSASY